MLSAAKGYLRIESAPLSFEFNSTICNSNQKWKNDIYANARAKIMVSAKKYYIWNPSTCISENSKCLEIILDDSKIVCDEIINFTDGVSTNVTNIISTNVTSTVLTNCHNKKGKYFTKIFD